MRCSSPSATPEIRFLLRICHTSSSAFLESTGPATAPAAVPASAPRSSSSWARPPAALAASGLTYKEIATRLGISSRTARNHLAHIYSKLEIHDRAHAALHAARLGLVEI